MKLRRITAIGLLVAAIGLPGPAAAGSSFPTVSFDYPLPARTGHEFTIRPVYSDGFVPAPGDACRWEFRWGDTPSLRDNDFNETFGFLLFEGSAAEGYCGDWTFTLPWVPVPQFELSFRGPVPTARSGEWPDREVFHAAIGTTDRRIRESNLPLVQVLPDIYTPTIGESITYTRYLVGGASAAGEAAWTAHLGSGEDPLVWERWGTESTFTITPPRGGKLFVQWHREVNGRLLSAGYDPPVRGPDRSKPNTSTPIHRLVGGATGATVPVKVGWSGTDSGWGIQWYRLERSVDGGAWTKINLPTADAASLVQALSPGHAYRYRVRATDKVGNVGAWDVGKPFRVERIGDTSPAVVYNAGWQTVAKSTALGGSLHQTSTAGAATFYRFVGTDIAFIAETGPGRGRVRITIDGVEHTTVDLHASATTPRQVVFAKHWTSRATHTIRVEALGTSGRPLVSADGFAWLR